MEKKRECTVVDDNIFATPIVEDITKMQMPHTESTGTCIGELVICVKILISLPFI